MLSPMPKYIPLKEPSDSPEPEPIANPQVQLPSSDSQTPPQPLYPIARTIPPLQPTAQTLKQTSDSPSTSAVRVTTTKTTFARSSVRTRCPRCRTEQMTKTEYKLGNANWCCCMLCFLFCGLFGCFALCIPCIMDVEHSCPNCNYTLGTFEPM